MLLPPLLYRGFDDRVEQSAPITDYVRPESLIDRKLKDVAATLNQLVPNKPIVPGSGLDEEGYSPQQRELQKFLAGKEPPPAVGTGPIYFIPKIAYETVEAIAWSKGSMNIAAASPEISNYEDSALVGIGPMII